jgi:hypothetical protein
METFNLDLLEHSFLNQVEADLEQSDFTAFSELMEMLLKNKENQDLIFNYLSDSAQKNLKQGVTFNRY